MQENLFGASKIARSKGIIHTMNLVKTGDRKKEMRCSGDEADGYKNILCSDRLQGISMLK